MKIYNTKCDKCIFKQTDGNKQIGCAFDIDKILVYNYPEMYSEKTIDKSNDSWVIKEFRCPYARTQGWKDELLKMSPEINPFDEVIKYCHMNFYMVIWCDSQEDDIEPILEDLKKTNTQKPKFISFILTRNSKYKRKVLSEILKNFDTCPYKIHYIVDPEATTCEAIDSCIETNLDIIPIDYLFIKYANSGYGGNILGFINDTLLYSYGKQAMIVSDNFLDGFTCSRKLLDTLYKRIGLVYDYITNDSSIIKIKIL